jgi:hypothetical protein
MYRVYFDLDGFGRLYRALELVGDIVIDGVGIEGDDSDGESYRL